MPASLDRREDQVGEVKFVMCFSLCLPGSRDSENALPPLVYSKQEEEAAGIPSFRFQSCLLSTHGGQESPESHVLTRMGTDRKGCGAQKND